MLASIKNHSNLLRRIIAPFSSVEMFSKDELAASHKYVEETLRSRTWVTYMLASYIPNQIRPAFYTIHLFDMELTKISENAREASLGTYGVIKGWASSIFGRSRSIRSTMERNRNLSPFRFACMTPFTPIHLQAATSNV
jgi:hypothetical protein